MPTRKILWLALAVPALTLVLVLTAAAAAPATAAPADGSASPLSGDPLPWLAATQATCVAHCQYGNDVACSGTSCSAQDDPNGYVQCGTLILHCPPPSLAVSLSDTDCRQIGDKSIYTLRATASGGSGSYSFSWLGANPSGGSTANPNFASTVVIGSSRTVTVTVTSGGASAQRSIQLFPGCF